MNTSIPWQTIAQPLDVFDIVVPDTFVRQWVSYEQIPSGVLFCVKTAGGQALDLRLDMIAPDVLRLRMNPEGIRERPSEMLVQDEWPAPPFSCHETSDCLTLRTARLRIECQRYPWQIRVYNDCDPLPFFSERIDDRAYGPAYEVLPVGFERLRDGKLTVHEAVVVTPGESFYGFGEKFTALDKWGHEIVSWAIDAGNVISHRSYKNIPFYLSSAGYGVFVHSSYPIVYRLGIESSISYSFHIADSQLDYFLIYGPSFKHILRRYSELTGFAPVPPKWSFGFWMSRAGYKSRAQVEAVVRQMRDRDLPCDVINLDPWWMGDGPWSSLEWDTQAFPDPPEMIQALRAQGVRTCLWITPYIPQGTALYKEGEAHGYFIRRADGNLAPVLEAFAGGQLAALDFTNPQAVKWYLDKLARLLEMGIAAFKTDFGEQAPVEGVYHDGRNGLEMHNLYPLLYNRAVFGLTERVLGRGLVWGRSAYAGSQRYPVQWGGDSYACLDHMSGQLRGLLSYGMSGVPFCGHDVGGFDYSPHAFDQEGQSFNVGEHVSAVSTALLEAYPLDPVVYVRWLQFGTFSSHMRAHGKAPHEPWHYGEEAERIARRYLKLRYRLLPYLYSTAVQAAQTGVPVVRPMVLDFQGDPNTYRLDTQYMFGDSFLVAPIFNPSGHFRVYLPAGDWINYWTKERISGGHWLEGTVSLDIIPLWVRAGAIIPMGPEMAYVDQKPLDPLILEIYAPQANAETLIYDEDRPPIAVRYTRQGDRLIVTVEGAPGEVEVVVYDTQQQQQTLTKSRTVTFRMGMP
ncbi:MAG: TIM-barrel domain-containing protein [Aggregatilineaceae bacterium]